MQHLTGKVEGTFIELPDGRMHYQSLGSGSPLILLHSMASSVWSWGKVMKPLARRHTVYALDTMGQGDSDKPSRDYSIEDYSGSVVSFMKAKGLTEASLIGCSVGAIFAVQIAAVNPATVDRLVLVGCPCRQTERERKEAMALFRAGFDDRVVPFPRSLEELKQHYLHVTPELQVKVNEDKAKAGVGAMKCYAAMIDFDIMSALKKVRASTLVIFGEKDLLRNNEKALEKYIKGSELVIIPKSIHQPHLDNPEAFLEVVQPFLE